MTALFWVAVGALVPIIGVCVFLGLVARDRGKRESD